MATTLVIGNKNYSSWSLRPWLLLRHAGVAFEEVRLPLDTPEFHERIGDWSPTGRVPVLHDHGLVVWDSLAICEYANERWLRGNGWPADPGRRAVARSVAAQMHSGFPALRAQLPMNCRREPRQPHWDAAAQRDIDQVLALWGELRAAAEGGDFLFGGFGIVDAMFAPVCVRLRGYGVPVTGAAAEYVEAVYQLPAMAEWLMAGRGETERVVHDEA
jgi:glutathione S-transferase